MSKNWSKIVLVSMLVLMVGASISMASTARVRTLAHTGDYIPDDSNVNRWYSTLPSYANQVTAEMGFISYDSDLSDTRALSWNIACGDEAEYGTYRISLNENAVDHPGLWMINPFHTMKSPGTSTPNLFGIGDGGFDTPINNWDLAGAWEIGENAAVGVSFTRSGFSIKSSDGAGSETNFDLSWTTFGVGGTWSNNEDLVLDGVFNFGMAGGMLEEVGTSSTATAEWDSKNSIDFAARGMWDWKDDVTVTPVIEFCTAEYSFIADAASAAAPIVAPDGDKWTNFMLGVGMDVDVNTDNTLIFAVEFNSMKWEFVNPPTSTTGTDTLFELSQTYLPTIRMALESDITSWMKTRVGAAKTIGKTTEKGHLGAENEYTTGAGIVDSDYSSDSFDWFLGVGFTVAEWTIDCELEQQTPFSLGYWLTGYSYWDQDTSSGPIARISAVYNY